MASDIRAGHYFTIAPNPGNHGFVPIHPSIPVKVELGLTVTFTALYSSLFLIIYIQLCMILYYKYKRLSYQSIFLMLCLFWASLRIVLFSFYFKNVKLVNNLPTIFYWLLFCFPVCLQFVILCLMVLYFSQLYFKMIYRNERHKHRPLIRVLVLIAVTVFISINVVSAIMQHNKHEVDPFSRLLLTRVIVCQLLFMTGVLVLSIFIIKIARCSTSKLVLEAKGLTVCQAVSACSLLVLLFTSRAAYNFVVVIMNVCNCAEIKRTPTFNFSWINISDQAHVMVKGSLYVTFGVVLFLWEFLPTLIVVMLYRVRRPPSSPTNMLEQASTHSFSSKVYFFDNPRRYDSEEDLYPSINNSSHGTEVMRSGSSVGFASSTRSTPYLNRSHMTNGSVSPSQFLSSSPYYQQYGSTPHSQSVPASMSKLLINPITAPTDV